MNSTVWHSLTGFVQYLGSSGKCKIDEGDKGWYIAYIDQEALIRKEEDQRKQQQEKDDEERHMQIMDGMVQRGKELAGDDEHEYEATELIRDTPDQKIQLDLNLGILDRKLDVKSGVASAKISIFDMPKVKKEDPDEPGPSQPSRKSGKKRSRSRSPAAKKFSKKSALDEIKEMEERKKERKNRKDYWMREGIVVKVISTEIN